MNTLLKTKVNFTVMCELTEGDVRALDALAGYGTKEFLDCFYKHLGEHYLKPYEQDLVNLFIKIKGLRTAIGEINDARKTLGLK